MKIKSLTFIAVIMIITLFTGSLKAQEDVVIRYPEQYLFPDFSVAQVAMKTGKDIFLLLNYSVVLEKMIFLQKGQAYEMLYYDNVDTVYLQDKKFVPYNKIFLEVAFEGKIPLFIRHTARLLGPSRPGPYGSKSEVSSSTYMNYLVTQGEPFRMKDIEELNLKYDNLYLIKINNDYKGFASAGQFLKLFPLQKASINQFIRKNRIKFDKPEDVVKVVKFCNGL